MIPKQRLRIISIWFLVTAGIGIAALLCSGCAKNPPTAANVNQTITTVIADAGTVAISAQQQYIAGSIPQTDVVRAAINDLGAAYEQAKRVYLSVLQAEQQLAHDQQNQIAACTPSLGAGAAATEVCNSATATALQSKTAADTANANLQNSVNILVSKTSAVKALSK